MIPSSLLWVAKGIVFVFACVLAYQGKLSPETAAVFASTLLSLGVTNAATVMAKTRLLATFIHQMAPGSTAPTLPPPAPSTPPNVPPAAAVGVLAFAVCAVVTVAIIGACTPAERQEASQIHEEGLRYECAHLPPLDAGHE